MVHTWLTSEVWKAELVLLGGLKTGGVNNKSRTLALGYCLINLYEACISAMAACTVCNTRFLSTIRLESIYIELLKEICFLSRNTPFSYTLQFQIIVPLPLIIFWFFVGQPSPPLEIIFDKNSITNINHQFAIIIPVTFFQKKKKEGERKKRKKIRCHCVKSVCISLCSVPAQENKDHKNSEYESFLRSVQNSNIKARKTSFGRSEVESSSCSHVFCKPASSYEENTQDRVIY